MIDFQQLFTSFSAVRIGVIGDVMLDTYVWGKVERISPEAPVPVVTMKGKEYRIGGAGNVALNCVSLGALVNIISVTGDDNDAIILKELLLEKNIDTSYMIASEERITTNKTRIISRSQQMMRLDAEITRDLDEKLEAALLEKIQLFIENEKPEIIIFEDYNKGVLTENLISKVIILCRQNGIVVAVDPKRKNFLSYKGVDIFKPNLIEVREGLNLNIDEINEPVLNNIHKELSILLNHKISLITLSEKGIFYQHNAESKILPSHIRNVADVSGAGDTVIAVASLVYAVTKNAHLMAEIANIAGGLVCEQVGTVAIDKDLLLKECQLLIS
jgi:D-glycero-beta-D-manno-heptose-7-phosphate kinase